MGALIAPVVKNHAKGELEGVEAWGRKRQSLSRLGYGWKDHNTR